MLSFRRQDAVASLAQGEAWVGRYNQSWASREVLRHFLRSVRRHVNTQFSLKCEGHKNNAEIWDSPGLAEWDPLRMRVKYGGPLAWAVMEPVNASKGWWDTDVRRLSRKNRLGQAGRAGADASGVG